MFHLGDIIRKLRDQRGWTQTALGQRAGLNKDTIKRIERGGANIRQDSLAKVAAAFALTVADLYTFLRNGEALHQEGETELRLDPYTDRLWRAWEALNTQDDQHGRATVVAVAERFAAAPRRLPRDRRNG